MTRAIATFFYLGYVPLAPGSMASLIGTLIYLLLYQHIEVYLGVLIVVCLLGFWASGALEKDLNHKDPSCVVIDEVAGVMIAFFMLPPLTSVMVTAFFLFRAFDMFKIYPADTFEAMPGGMGIMIDDIIAGLYTNIIMHAALGIVGTLKI